MADAGPCDAETGTHRVADGRESDVRLTAGERVLLVEHKVGDHFRAGQADGYRAEVDRYRILGLEAAAIVVAPRAQLALLDPEARGRFDGELATEDAAETLTDPHAVIRHIAERLRHAGAAVIDDATDPQTIAFGNDYRAALGEVGSTLRLGPQSFTRAGAPNANFVGSTPGARYLFHTLSLVGRGAGRVALTIPPSRWREPTLPAGANLLRPADRNGEAGYQVTFDVPAMDKSRPLQDQIDAFLEAVSAAEILRDWWAALDR